MQIMYCETCGVRISEEELKSGVAFQESALRAYCTKCSSTRQPTKSLQKPPSRENVILQRPATGPARPVTGQVRATQTSTQLRATRAKNASPSMLLPVGVGAGVLGVLLIGYALMGGKKPPQPPKVDIAVTPTPPTQPVPFKTPEIKKPEIKAPEIKSPPVEPEKNPTPAVDLTQRTPPSQTPSTPTPAIDDIRENYAKRKWAEVKADAERKTSGLDAFNATKAVQDFATTYSSTAAGKEAAEYVKKMPASEIKALAVYSRDFKGPAPTAGWAYMWNDKGEIGKVANYSPLVWNAGQGIYCTDEKTYPGGPGSYASLRPTGCHPGPGAPQGQAVHRYVIAAYTIQAGQSGKALLSGKIQRVTMGHGGKVDVRVYIGDNLKHSQSFFSSATMQDFTVDLGTVKEGETAYICVGPDGDDACDTAALNFMIQAAP